MIKLDILGLSQPELAEAVHYHCAQYGRVASVKIFMAGSSEGRVSALVGMQTREEGELLAWKLGDQLLDDGGVLVVIKQESIMPKPALSWAHGVAGISPQPVAA